MSQMQKCLSEDLIKNYLGETLAEKERFEVEDHLLDCPLCSDAVEGLSASYDFHENSSLQKLDDRFTKEMNKEEILVKTLKSKSRFSVNRVAAAILLLLVPLAGWLYWNSTANERLYADFLPEQDGLSIALRGDNTLSEEEIPIQEAKRLYEVERYEASLAASQKVLEQMPQHALATYYAGLSAIETGAYSLARDYLSTLRINHPNFYEDATWYLVLNEIKAGEKEKAKKILEELLQLPQGKYFSKANKLMQEI